MPHVKLPEDAPGITGLLAAYPQTGRRLRALAEELLRGPSPLSPAEREIIAAYVSTGNECVFCARSHSAAARSLLGERNDPLDRLLSPSDGDGVDPRLAPLLNIAEKVRRDGRLVTAADVEQARAAGADDRAIHDTVLIAAAFSMFNRYVDGLATATPTDERSYVEMGKRMAQKGYGPASD